MVLDPTPILKAKIILQFELSIEWQNSLHFDYTYFNYLAQQAGGLTDVMFNQNPRATDLETGLQ
jgi:outer membrane receptor for Fe3+-dicitrate